MKHAIQALSTAALLVALTGSAHGFHVGSGLLQPTLLRLTGFVGSAPAAVTTLGQLTLGLDHTVTTLELADVQMLNGPLTEGRSALRDFELYSPNLLLVGNAALLQSITTAPAQARLTIFGYLSPGSRRLVVVEVQAS